MLEILKNYQTYYTIIQLSGVGEGRVVKKEKFTAADQSNRWLISQNWSVTLPVVLKTKKKTSTLTLVLMNQMTWPLINFLFLLLLFFFHLPVMCKITVKSDQFFRGYQFFSATNNFPQIKLTLIFFTNKVSQLKIALHTSSRKLNTY